MKKRYMEDWRESKYLQIPGLKDNTTYYIYALLYDNDGVPAGLSRATATTKAKANDEFSVNVTDIKSNTATVTFTPKDTKAAGKGLATGATPGLATLNTPTLWLFLIGLLPAWIAPPPLRGLDAMRPPVATAVDERTERREGALR